MPSETPFTASMVRSTAAIPEPTPSRPSVAFWRPDGILISAEYCERHSFHQRSFGARALTEFFSLRCNPKSKSPTSAARLAPLDAIM